MSAINKYNSYLELIKKGWLGYEEEARELAVKHHFNISDLETALEQGKPKHEQLLESYAYWITA